MNICFVPNGTGYGRSGVKLHSHTLLLRSLSGEDVGSLLQKFEAFLVSFGLTTLEYSNRETYGSLQNHGSSTENNSLTRKINSLDLDELLSVGSHTDMLQPNFHLPVR